MVPRPLPDGGVVCGGGRGAFFSRGRRFAPPPMIPEGNYWRVGQLPEGNFIVFGEVRDSGVSGPPTAASPADSREVAWMEWLGLPF